MNAPTKKEGKRKKTINFKTHRPAQVLRACHL
jgi:hypothetical protein